MEVNHKKRYNNPKLQDDKVLNVTEGYFYSFLTPKISCSLYLDAYHFFLMGKKKKTLEQCFTVSSFLYMWMPYINVDSNTTSPEIPSL